MCRTVARWTVVLVARISMARPTGADVLDWTSIVVAGQLHGVD